MRQQVNLYQPILRREKKVFSAQALLTTLLVVIAALAVVTGLMFWGQHRQAAELAQLQARKSSAEAQVSALEARYQPPKKDAALEQAVQRLRGEIRAKEAFLERFDPSSVSFGGGFAPWLEGLARQTFDGIWLDGFSLYGDGQVDLSGGALKPQYVPRLVQRLGRERVFEGRDFRELRLNRPDGHTHRVHFTLSSSKEKTQ